MKMIQRLLILACALGTNGWTQNVDTATVLGTVTDATGAVIPGATIEIIHAGTNTTTRVQTGEEGRFRTPPVRIGEYLISVEANGFKRVTRRGVVLNVGDVRQVDFTLEVGQVTESVEVVGAAPLLQTSESAAGTVIANKQIVELPLNGRDYLQLALLSGGTTPSRGTGVSIGAQRGTEVNFLIDGIDNNNQSIATQGNQKEAVKPQVDAVQEFKVVTNGFAAEYGRSSAGVVNLTLKSGSNEIHGTVFEFLRNEKLDARNFFDPPNRPKPPFKRNQYGFAAGGPIVKNKAFIFGDLELTDVRESSTTVSTVPGVAERAGRFSTPIYDPAAFNAAAVTRQPFANNTIPAARFDSLSVKTMDFWPLPQTAGRTNNFTFQAPRQEDYRKWDVRYDQILTPSDNYFFRFSSQRQDRPVVRQIPDASIGPVSRTTGSAVDSYNMALVYNRVWSPATVTSIRAGYNYLYTSVKVAGDKDLNSVLGVQGVDTTLPGTPEIEVSGFRSIGTTNFNPNLINSQTRQLSGDTTINKANHTLKFGISVYWMQSHIINPQRAKGRFEFDNRFTQQLTPRGGGEPLADFLLGHPHTIFSSNFVYMNLRSPITAYYLQDDWRVTKNLTLNLGVRYEIYPPWVETRDLIANYDIDTNPASPVLIVAGEKSKRRADRAMVATDYTNIAPRVGLAYALNSKTVIRSAYGIFYGNVTNTGGGEFMQTNPPFHLKVSLSSDVNQPNLQFRNGVPPGALDPRNAQALRLSSFERNAPWPIAQSWNFNVQRQLPFEILFEIGYYANKMDHAVKRYDANYARPGPGDINARRRYPTVVLPGGFPGTQSEMNRFQNDANFNYHGLQMKGEKRFSRGMTFIMTYAWSKGINDAGGIQGSGNAPGDDWSVQDPLNFRAERGLSPTHMAHRFVGSYVYEVPFGRGRQWGAGMHRGVDAVLRGWALGGILTLSAGSPMNLTVQGNPSNSGGRDRPDVVGDWRLPRGERTIDRFFNTAAFAPNQRFAFGNAGRNVLSMPGTVNYDFSATKNFVLTDRYNLQFRFEAFSFTNTPSFDAPNTQVGNRNIGVISSAGGRRNLQFGLKFQF
jgi:hypothetical protein